MPRASARQQTISLLNGKILETRTADVLQASDDSESNGESQSSSSPKSEDYNETTMLFMRLCLNSQRYFARILSTFFRPCHFVSPSFSFVSQCRFPSNYERFPDKLQLWYFPVSSGCRQRSIEQHIST